MALPSSQRGRRELQSHGTILARFVSELAAKAGLDRRMGLEEWTAKHRSLRSHPFSLERYPYMKAVYADQTDFMTIMKGAQTGVSEFFINKTLWSIDVLGMSVLYLLPTQDDAKDFSQTRFDAALEGSPYLSSLFTDVSRVDVKRAGERVLYLVGSRSDSALHSKPVDFLVMDEYDKLNQKNIPKAEKRLDGSRWQWSQSLSTPTLPEYGIHREYMRSNQQKYMVQCPHCNHWQVPAWPDCCNLEAPTPYYWCVKCHTETPAFWPWKGEWVAQKSGVYVPGYHIPQFISPTKNAAQVARSYMKAQGHPDEETEWWNQVAGEPYVAKGAGLDDNDLLACQDKEYTEMPNVWDYGVMGVDVGSMLHVVITAPWGPGGMFQRTLFIGTVTDFDELAELMTRYNVIIAVIDINPETRMVKEFCNRHPGRAFGCDYTIPVDSSMETVWPDEPSEEVSQRRDGITCIRANRTMTLGTTFSRFTRRQVALPAHFREQYPDCWSQLKAPKRVMVEKKGDGKKVYRYVETGDDHYAHAWNYNTIGYLRLINNLPPTDDYETETG